VKVAHSPYQTGNELGKKGGCVKKVLRYETQGSLSWNSRMRALKDDCWICQSLREPAHLVIYESKTSVAKLNPDQLFQGYTFLTLKWHAEQFHQLAPRDRTLFLQDMTKIGQALAKALEPDRLNYELLGNTQAHLHWHIVPRYRTDPMWGRPIWAGSRSRKRLTQDGYVELVKKVQAQFSQSRKALSPAK
jgi:diadenosine tetraphosphate (Ap4A) HIT family hydrolase